MIGVVTALGTLAAIAVVGWLLGRHRVLGENAAPVLARTTFTVAIPALLVVTVAHADLDLLVSRFAAVVALTTTVVAAVATVFFAVIWRLGTGEATVATLASSYVNAAHLGIPIAVYVVGDAVAAVPMLLFQQLVLAPVAFTMLDRAHAGVRPVGVVSRTLRNPIIVATLVGLLLAFLPWDLPETWYEPLRIVGAAAAPLALVTFGMSLAVPRPPGQPWVTRELTVVVVLRSLVHPLLAMLVGALLGLRGHDLMAVVTMSALPTAQNVLVFAMQYGRGQQLARDAGLVTTLLTAPVMLIIAATLG